MPGGRPPSPEEVLAKRMGFTGKGREKIIRRLGGVGRLDNMQPEARAFMLGLAKKTAKRSRTPRGNPMAGRPPGPETKPVTIVLLKPTYRQIAVEAAQKDMPVSSFIRELLEAKYPDPDFQPEQPH